MFSGIIEELGEVESVDPETGRLRVLCTVVPADARRGDSVAVNGCCLTMREIEPRGFVADVVPETFARTTLGSLRHGDRVNLEAAIRQDQRVGGHLVSGHVDGVGTVTAAHDEGNAVCVRIAAPAQLGPLLVEKGCIAVDGISLTVTTVEGASFGVCLIPHTRAVTTASGWREGSSVNLETDLVAKYVQRSVRVHLEATRPLRPVS